MTTKIEVEKAMHHLENAVLEIVRQAGSAGIKAVSITEDNPVLKVPENNNGIKPHYVTLGIVLSLQEKGLVSVTTIGGRCVVKICS